MCWITSGKETEMDVVMEEERNLGSSHGEDKDKAINEMARNLGTLLFSRESPRYSGGRNDASRLVSNLQGGCGQWQPQRDISWCGAIVTAMHLWRLEHTHSQSQSLFYAGHYRGWTSSASSHQPAQNSASPRPFRRNVAMHCQGSLMWAFASDLNKISSKPPSNSLPSDGLEANDGRTNWVKTRTSRFFSLPLLFGNWPTNWTSEFAFLYQPGTSLLMTTLNRKSKLGNFKLFGIKERCGNEFYWQELDTEIFASKGQRRFRKATSALYLGVLKHCIIIWSVTTGMSRYRLPIRFENAFCYENRYLDHHP